MLVLSRGQTTSISTNGRCSIPIWVTYHSEYMVSKEHSKGPEEEWFWWDIVEAKLESVKMYDITNAEYEKARVEDMKERERGALEMARRSRGELTDEEREEIDVRNARMGVVHELDRNDPDIMGIEQPSNIRTLKSQRARQLDRAIIITTFNPSQTNKTQTPPPAPPPPPQPSLP
jgi:hypothetical protein